MENENVKQPSQFKRRAAEFWGKVARSLWYFIKANYLMFGYVIVALVIELTGVAVTSGRFYITEPWMFFTFVSAVCLISLYLPGHRSRYGLFTVALAANFIFDLIFIVVFDSTGGTVFDYAMLHLRNDAMNMLETIPFDFAFVFVSGLLIALYCTFGIMLMKRMPVINLQVSYKITTASLLVLVFTANWLLVFFSNFKRDSNDLSYMLEQPETGTYSNKGIIGNFYNELVRGIWFSDIDVGDEQELKRFIYDKPTESTQYYGYASGYNVVTILCESFEWFTFLCDEARYPNGYAKQIKLRLAEPRIAVAPENGAFRVIVTGKAENNTLYDYKSATVNIALYDELGEEVGVVTDGTTSLSKDGYWEVQATGVCSKRPVSCKIKSAEVVTGLKPEPVLYDTQEQITEVLRGLYPNLYRMYESESTFVLYNSHSLEKTDISENKSIIGNYPLNEYINYAYPENTLPYSMPNVLKSLYGIQSNSFHNGLKTFYNRNIHHVNALGFNSYTSSEDMGCYKDDGSAIGERNLDSLMFDACKEQMFPTDRRYNTFITTITQHGRFAERENLRVYYDRLDATGLLPFDEDDEDATALRYYCAAGMDFDAAIGIMLDYLEQTGQADRTLITMFGDHNAYYQGITNYVKDIYSTSATNYTELYRVPVMIKVGDRHLDNRIVTKFTCVSDIYPTVLDLLGIMTFSGLTYGVSAFNGEQTSVLYSRAYNKFLTDKIYFNTLSSINYKHTSVDDEYLTHIRTTASALLDKISHVNRIFASDFFKGENADEFYTRLGSLNQ